MAKKAAKTRGGGDVIFTENAIVITLDAKAQRQAMRCLQKSGKITFSVREHSVTKLPQVLENGKLID